MDRREKSSREAGEWRVIRNESCCIQFWVPVVVILFMFAIADDGRTHPHVSLSPFEVGGLANCYLLCPLR